MYKKIENLIDSDFILMIINKSSTYGISYIILPSVHRGKTR